MLFFPFAAPVPLREREAKAEGLGATGGAMGISLGLSMSGSS
jgi:hypothetical protein